jgi:hypothetical protein
MTLLRGSVLLLALGVLLVAWVPARAAQTGPTGTICGKTIEGDGTPIEGATISAWDGPNEGAREVATTTTAADGTWSMAVPADQPWWIHFNTFRDWWGYSYSPPIVLKAGETCADDNDTNPKDDNPAVDFVLGPRSIRTPIPTVPPFTPTPEAAASPTAEVVPTVEVVPTAVPTLEPPGMPRTGAGGDGWVLFALFAAGVVSAGGMALRRRTLSRR